VVCLQEETSENLPSRRGDSEWDTAEFSFRRVVISISFWTSETPVEAGEKQQLQLWERRSHKDRTFIELAFLLRSGGGGSVKVFQYRFEFLQQFIFAQCLDNPEGLSTSEPASSSLLRLLHHKDLQNQQPPF